jgi:hypothetical protein
MKASELEDFLINKYKGLKVLDTYSERSLFYNPDSLLPKGIYFATFKSQNGPNDKASDLDRENVYRFNFGMSKNSYEKLFGVKPKRPLKGGVVNTGHDFTKLNTLTPHPIYAWLSWVAILNPNQSEINKLTLYLDESYNNVLIKYDKKMKI